MKQVFVLGVLCVLCGCLFLGGCGNVTLKGEALTAAQASTVDALQAVNRAEADPATPAWEKAYLRGNFKQWRLFVRSAMKDLAWGPRLPEEKP